MSEEKSSKGTTEKKSERRQQETSDMLTARSGLLEYYNGRTISFSSLFVASIFGLVTWLAIVQAIKVEGFYYYLFMLGTSVIYLAFVLASWYTFQRFSFYAAIAEKLVSIDTKGSLSEYAKTEEMEFTINKELFDKLPDDLKKQTKGEKDRYVIPFKLYFDYRTKEQEKSFLKKFILGRHFKTIYIFLLILLWLLVYAPSLIPNVLKTLDLTFLF